MTKAGDQRAASEESEPPSQNATVPPPFDPERFARESESDLLAAEALCSQPTRRPPSMASVPVPQVSAEDAEWFALDPGLRSLLAMVDGARTVEAISTRLGRSDLDAVRGLSELIALGMIGIRE